MSRFVNKYNNYIKICDVFHTIQGEGSWAGMPALFIRLSGCNLTCSFCDEPTHRDASKILFEGKPSDASLWVMREWGKVFLDAPHTHIVISGGEPTIYLYLDDFINGLREQYTRLFSGGKNRLLISVESNGFRPHRASLVDLYTCSPKFLTKAKVEKGQSTWIIYFLNKDDHVSPNSVDLKYLYGTEVDANLIILDIINTLNALVEQLPLAVVRRVNFFISPINDELTIRDENVKATLELLNHLRFEIFSRYGLKPPRLSMQLHKILGVK